MPEANVLALQKKIILHPIITSLDFISEHAEANADENVEFRAFLKQQPEELVDAIVHGLNEEISPQIDCTSCGNCCRSFMINVTEEEAANVAAATNNSVNSFKEKYIEQSAGGQMIINTIPCHFLEGNICTVYTNRFSECREFPHLHKDHVQQRLFGLLMYYGKCPIIYNVIEQTKMQSGFFDLYKKQESAQINSL